MHGTVTVRQAVRQTDRLIQAGQGWAGVDIRWVFISLGG